FFQHTGSNEFGFAIKRCGTSNGILIKITSNGAVLQRGTHMDDVPPTPLAVPDSRDCRADISHELRIYFKGRGLVILRPVHPITGEIERDRRPDAVKK